MLFTAFSYNTSASTIWVKSRLTFFCYEVHYMSAQIAIIKSLYVTKKEVKPLNGISENVKSLIVIRFVTYWKYFI